MTYWPAESATYTFPSIVKNGSVFVDSREAIPAILGLEVAGGI